MNLKSFKNDLGQKIFKEGQVGQPHIVLEVLHSEKTSLTVKLAYLNNFVSDKISLLNIVKSFVLYSKILKNNLTEALKPVQLSTLKIWYYNNIYLGNFINAELIYQRIFKLFPAIFKLNIHTEIHDELVEEKESQLFDNKKIVIIGPANIEFTVEDLTQIEDADVLILPNLLSIDDLSNRLDKNIDFFSNKTCISFWNGEQADYRLEKDLPFDKNVIHFFKGDRHTLKVNTKKGVTAFTIRAFPKLAFANPNMVQLILAELERFNYKSIFICGIDLMLTVKRVNNYYPEVWNKEGLKRIEKMRQYHFIGHDPAEQFLILQEFKKDRRNIYNKRLNEIIQNGLKEYFTQLQSVYGKKQ